MFKSELLREFVTERLAAATRDILAVVDRSVAGLEDEAAGLRQEIDRQKKQLEVLLQPRVRLYRADVRSVKIEEGAEDEETESPEDPKNLEDSPHQPPSRSGQYWNNPNRPQNRQTPKSVTFLIRILKDPHTVMLHTTTKVFKKFPIQKLECPGSLNEADFLALLRSTFPQLDRDKSSLDFLVSDKTRKLRLLKLNALTPKEILKHIYNPNQGILTIRLKERQERIPPRETKHSCTGDSPSTNEPRLHTSNPVQEMQEGELETEEADDDNDGYDEANDDNAPEESNEKRKKRETTKNRKGMRCEIKACMLGVNPGDSEDDDEEDFSHEDPEYLDDSMYQPPSRSGQYDKRNPRRLQNRPTPQSVTFQIRILKDPHTVMLSTKSPVFKEFPIQKLECPGSLNEADFLALLRSTFPQLDRDKSSFDFLVSDKTRKLRLLKLNALTPKEILKHIYNPSQGILSILLKEHQERIPPQETKEGCTGDSPSTNEPRLLTGSGRYDKKKRRKLVTFRIRILRNPHTVVLSNKIYKKCPMRKLLCPRDLNEAGFLDLLRSSFPQLDRGSRLVEILVCDKTRKLRLLKLKALTPNDILKHIWHPRSGSLCIRLKERQERIPPRETKEGCTGDSPSTNEPRLLTGNPGQAEQQQRHQKEMEKGEAHEEDDNNDDGTGVPESAEDLVDCSAGPSEGQGGEERPESKDNNEPEENNEKRKKRATTKNKERPQASDSEDDIESESCHDSKDDWRPDGAQDSDKPDESNEKRKKRETAKNRRSNKRRRIIKTRATKTESGDVVFPCKVCGALHESEVALVKHAWSHVEDPGSVECGVCGERSESVETLKDHLQTQHRTYNCHICDETFLKALSFNEHVAAHSGVMPYECEVCHEAFALEVSLKDHQKVHRGRRPRKSHICDICGKSVTTSRGLAWHKILHSEERAHTCDTCGKSFKLLNRLRFHKRIHSERARHHLCEICPTMFMSRAQLQAHIRRHTNWKPYQCAECGKAFRTTGELTRHKKVHTGEKPFQCLDCGQFFNDRSHLKNHMTIHSGVKPFVCKICGSAHRQKDYLDIHMRTHTGERPYKCSLCDRAFTQGHCLKTHMKSHRGAETAT